MAPALFRRKSVSVYANLLLRLCLLLKLYSTVNQSKQSVVLTDTNVVTGMNCCTSLSDNDIAGCNCLTVRLLYAETLGFAITAVLCRTYTLFMGEEL